MRRVGDQRLELTDDAAGRVELGAGGELGFEQPESQLVEPAAVGRDPVTVAGGRQQVAAEQRQRLGRQRLHAGHVTAPPSLGHRAGQPGGAGDVDVVGIDVEEVAAPLGHDGMRIAERPAQLRHLRLQGVAGGGDGGARPQVLDQAVGRDARASVERQPHQQLRRPTRRHGSQHPVAAHLDRSEDGDGEHRGSLGSGSRSSGDRQLVVSARLDDALMTDDELLQALVVVAVRSGRVDLLDTAAAVTVRQRQLVALARLHLAGDDERFDALVRDHLSEHPDHVVAAWLAAVHRTTTTTERRPRC